MALKGVSFRQYSSGLKCFSQVMESLISDIIIKDMAPNLDKSQFGNQKSLSINHYLVKLVHTILNTLDKQNIDNKPAIIASMIDWSSAFSG